MAAFYLLGTNAVDHCTVTEPAATVQAEYTLMFGG